MVDDCAAPRFNLITAFEPTCQSLAAMACFSDKNVLSLAFNMTWSWLADAPPLASQGGLIQSGGSCSAVRRRVWRCAMREVLAERRRHGRNSAQFLQEDVFKQPV